MWIPPMGLARPLFLVVVGVTAVAVLLGRSRPSVPDVRRPATPRYRPGPDILLREPIPQSGLHLFDAERGMRMWTRLDGADRMLLAAGSPWQDGLGRTHVAGLWKEFDGPYIRRMGLARCALPGGAVLDRIELEILPASARCWPPGLGTWVVYPGMDGVLYRLAFEDGAPGPRALSWRCVPPWNGRVAIVDASWPSDPRLASTIVVRICKTRGY